MPTTTTLTYQTPCTSRLIWDWPSGRYQVAAKFWIETDLHHGQRCCRQTQHPIKGTWSAPKKTTYAEQVRLVTGSDGRTYVLALHGYGSLSVMQGNLQFQQEYITISDPRYWDLVALLMQPTDHLCLDCAAPVDAAQSVYWCPVCLLQREPSSVQ